MVEYQIRGRGVKDERVLEALKRIPRHEFVPETRREESYDDTPLPIGYNQTISQPYIVGVMTELLEVRPTDRILEVGTGCGYQAAVLAELAEEVHSIEIVGALANQAHEMLRRLGYENVRVHLGDGHRGWPEAAPYDGILLTAAPETLPAALFSQVKEGRAIVAPVGPLRHQELVVFQKQADGSFEEKRVFDVRFVPLLDSAPPE